MNFETGVYLSPSNHSTRRRVIDKRQLGRDGPSALSQGHTRGVATRTECNEKEIHLKASEGVHKLGLNVPGEYRQWRVFLERERVKSYEEWRMCARTQTGGAE